MRHLSIPVVVALLAATGCGDNNKANPDGGPGPRVDAAIIDARPDAVPDAPPDTPPLIPDGIAEARAAVDGTGLTLAIHDVKVTYLKPQIGSLTNDPAGFTIQASMMGPALFISVDPSTLTPPAAVGDTVSFTITTMGTVGGQRRAQAITGYTRSATGANVSALSQTVSAATDLVTAIDSYDSELVTVTGVLFENLAASGGGFQRSGLMTAGSPADTNLQLRVPATVADALDMVMGCQVTATNVPMGRFNTQAQIGVFAPSDFVMTGCAAPTVANVTSLSATSVRVTFTRHVLATSVMVNGSQFTFDNGLTATAAAVSGKTVTLTTTAQTGATTYALTVANTVTDLQGSAVGTPNTGNFQGFLVSAVVRINELNANITSSCDLIELRVVSGGSMTGFTLKERAGGSGELSFTFPAFNVQTNDLIVVHTIATAATCNPNSATAETTAPNQQPSATFAGNFDTAFDFWAVDNGLTFTNNVITLFDATSAVVDAVFVSDGTAAAAAGTLSGAAIVGTANQWIPAQTAYSIAEFTAAAVLGLGTTGTTVVGNSIQRLDDTDDNNKADWNPAPLVSTWGALNMGQTAF